MEKINCVVERITYRNEENGYAVIRVRASDYLDIITAVGNMPEIHVGAELELRGDWKIDKKYGRQFAVSEFEEKIPATVKGIERFIGSGLIKGIGPKYAKKIVEQFGEETLTVIEEKPERLLEVDGIGKLRVEKIKESWEEQKEIKNIMIFLQGNEVSTGHAVKIYKTYGNESISIVKENPYRLADDIWGIGFKTADSIAEKMGFGHNRYERLRSGIIYTLNKLSEEGNCYSTKNDIIIAGSKLLDVDAGVLESALEKMIVSNDVISETMELNDKVTKDEKETAIYLPVYYYSEIGVSKRLCELAASKNKYAGNDGERLRDSNTISGVIYNTIQEEAIKKSIENKIMILTGGPGTGKTTTTMGIIAAYKRLGAKVVLAAPTGRAAKRLSEVTGMEAKTIHRLLEIKPPQSYNRNENNPIEGDVLIVDECSMIDIMLMHSLMKAIPNTMNLILVGDADQLPSVGAGNVLNDIIDSGRFCVVRLDQIFRQAKESRIIMNAHKINKGVFPDISNGKTTDFFFVERERPEEVLEQIVMLVTEKLPKYYKVRPKDIQVLTPMQRGVVGAVNLNENLQNKINPENKGIKHGGILYKAGDKVMQIRNDYEKEVFNGDIGDIELVDTDNNKLLVDYDGRKAEYEIADLDELTLAYATTIHKSQGSEYSIVVMPVIMSHYVMLQRNLIYTGVTRAKKAIVVVGTKKALSYSINHVTVKERNTRLRYRLSNSDAIEEIDDKYRYNRTRNENIFERLAQSEFRRRFKLGDKDKEFLREKGYDVIRSHAEHFIDERIAPAIIPNDGKQTPMNGHPVFIAQHATATCCRGCIEKWYGIDKNREMTKDEKEYIVDIILKWISMQS